ncbi:MAG: hypothetical protein ACI9D0_002104 [Bacteroidia bacterium]|jgi:hypothetical protein
MRLLTIPALALSALALGNVPSDVPIELGLVNWERSFPAAQAMAKSADKPVLLLFQEVPG